MKTRIITAVIGIIIILGLIAFGDWPLTLAMLVVSGIALVEYGCMLEHKNIKIHIKTSLFLLIVILLSAHTGVLKLFISGIFAALLVLCSLILKLQKKSINNLIYTIFGTLYLGIGFGSLLFLRQSSELLFINFTNINSGVFVILLALIGTWASDSFAYFTGRRFGQHKMAPHISPNKTVEGLIGGILGTVILCTAFSLYFGIELWKSVLCSVVIAIVAPIGDLFESYLKRVCEVKDSGKLLPGHGGVLDRFDSILFVSPSMLIILCLLQIG